MNNENIKTRKALVTGATGFLGKHLCEQLNQSGWTVYALCRNAEKAKELDNCINIVIGDILSTDLFTESIPNDVNALFHTAASTNSWFKNNAMQTRTNIQGTQNMLDLAIEKNITRFIHVSSVVVFGMHSQLQNVTEDLPKDGENSFINYVKTKTVAEKTVLTSEIDKVIINPTHIIGPGDKHNWARLIKMIAEEKLPSVPNGAGSFVDVRDVAAGIIAAYFKGKNGENYLLGGTDMNFKQFVYAVAEKFSVKPTKVQVPNFMLMALGKLNNLVSRVTNKEPDITPESVAIINDLYACDAKKARKHLGYETRDFRTSLNDAVNYLKSENIIK